MLRSVVAAALAAWCVHAQRGDPTIIVVGGGLAGAATAYHLRQALESRAPEARIIVIEKDRIGGRLRDEAGVELGATVWHSRDRLMNRYTEVAGVERVSAAQEAGHFAIWNGRELVFTQPPGGIWGAAALRMVWRYGLSPVYAQSAVTEVADRLGWVYSAVAEGGSPPFNEPQQLLQKLGVLDLSQTTLRAYLRERGFSAAFVDEIAEGVLRNNYGIPAAQVSALAGLFAM
eukprot:Hpha_TRINITY_DN17410_c0_g1::TRINITY_DN17410_c0_g1_i1::g.85884::m.85884/K05906/PCYOX1, FCLY; prenylcysteine oxidase / farnesylcysteine lyase